jgi:hypothetical protein
MDSYERVALAAFLRPFVLLIVFLAIVIPLKRVFMRFWPEGRVKRLLLKEWH